MKSKLNQAGSERRNTARNWPSVKGHGEQRASYALSRLEDITRLMAEWVWEVGADGRITFVSERVTQDLGFHASHFLGRTFDEIGAFTEERRACVAPDWSSPFRDAAYEIRDVEGKVRRLLISGLPIYHPETWQYEGACGTARDITEIRASREAKASLEYANRILRETNNAKSAFLAGVSHELRTPLNAILGFSQILNDQMFGPIENNQYLEYISGIHESGEHLLSLVNDVLDLSRIEAGELVLDEAEIDIKKTVMTCLNMVRHMPESRGIDLHQSVTDDLPKLRADERMVRQVLLNLLSNAVKYTPEGGKVTIAAGMTEKSGICFEISDTGVGIPESDLALVLRPFGRRNPELADKVHGFGLGLTIADALMRQHNGVLAIESEVDKGTKVKVVFPAERVLRRPANGASR